VKIVDRKTFLEHPPETLYMKFAPHHFGELCIKGETLRAPSGEAIDWYYQDFDNVDANDTGEWLDALERAMKGASITLDFDCQDRDGLFDQDQLFAVWEPDDVRALVERLQRCLPPEG